MSTTSSVPVYYETSWSIMSTIGLVNVLVGFVVVGITSLSPVTLVPIVVSAANAVADGLCYFAFYANYPVIPTAIAAAFADIFWLIQEAGLSFYSYLILSRILRSRDRVIFLSVFWTLMAFITTLRLLIMASRLKDILNNSLDNTILIDRLHTGYFVSLALVEMLSSYYLLRKFFKAKRFSEQARSDVSLFRYLLRSTEIRLAVLMLIGITRSITYSFQETAQTATSVSGQVDRFVATLECQFPIIMYIDILAAKSVVVHTQTHSSSIHSRAVHDGHRNRVADSKAAKNSWPVEGQGIYSMGNIQTHVDGGQPRSSSQEHIVGASSLSGKLNHSSSFEADRKGGGINKTVEFVLHESDSV